MSKNTPSSYAGDKNGYTVAQCEALDAIGDALKCRQINFHIATKLRDFVRSGRVAEAQERLLRHKHGPKL